MTAADLVQRIGAKRNGKGWVARCPAHDDRTPSLGIDEAPDGRALVHCRAGCSQPAVIEALRARGMWDPCAPSTVQDNGAFGWDDKVRIGGEAKPCNAAQETPRTRRKIVKTYDYTDAAGKLLFQVVRYEPKDFRQRRPVPDKPGAWTWSLNGQERVLYRLPAVIEAKAKGRAVFCVEGEKDADALVDALGMCATCNAGGAAKWTDAYTEALTSADVVIVADKDEPGRRHAALVTEKLTGQAKSIRVVELPDRDGHAVKDAADWIHAGGTAEELKEIVRNTPVLGATSEHLTAAALSAPVETKVKPSVLLPTGAQSISDTGRTLGELLANTERFFLRGGAVVKLATDPDGLPHLEDVRAAALASDFETVASLCKLETVNGAERFKPATCPEQTAKLIAASAAFRDAMLPIHVLTRCPVLIERAGRLIQVSGYDRASGILAAGDPAEPMDAAEARRLLLEVLAGFRFATPGDRARALAAMVTPALVFGGLLRGRAPVDLGEADASQTGKGYRNKLTAALYAQSVKTVTQQRAGVGSMEESFNMALIRGANFIALDNVRGKIDSPSFESFLTEDTYHARAPYREPVEIDPRRVVIMLTSNKADVTTDLSNRCACVELRKQPDGHAFTPYPEGDILEHVRANQARYLGAVFAIVRAWHDAGKPRTAETQHDFRPWAQTLDWITRNLLDAGPLLEGHRETQARMTNPVLNWLRDVALDVIRARKAGVWLRASDLVDVMAESGTETPGLPEHGDLTDPETRENTQRATGRKLGLCFRAADVLTLDGMTVERREGYDPGRFKTTREYRFTGPPIDGGRMDGNHAPAPATAQLDFSEPAAKPVSAHSPPMDPPMDPPIKTLIPPIPPMTSLQSKHSGTATKEEGVHIASMGTYGRMGGTNNPTAAEIEEGEI